MEDRKTKERDYHNKRRDSSAGIEAIEKKYSTQDKWYSIVRKSRECWENWLKMNCVGKKVLDYGCGDGDSSLELIKMGAAEVVGIDISDVSVENAKRKASKEGLNERTQFYVMDAEDMKFEDNSFDVIYESGVLHHLDLQKAYAELSRVLRSDGAIICNEALGHNPLIQYYREKTPHLRTEWELKHILKKKDIDLAEVYFNKVDKIGFFHLTSIGAVPFRKTSAFKPVLKLFETVDNVLLRLPLLRWQAWQVIFVLSHPKE